MPAVSDVGSVRCSGLGFAVWGVALYRGWCVDLAVGVAYAVSVRRRVARFGSLSASLLG